MADRTWTVRINLDALAAEMLALDGDDEKGAWLTGFQVGAAGARPRDSWPDVKLQGWKFGIAACDEAEAFRQKKSTAGNASASARRRRNGSAQPTRAVAPEKSPTENAEHCSNGVRRVFDDVETAGTSENDVDPGDSRTLFERCSTSVREILEQTSNQPTANSQQQEEQQQPARGVARESAERREQAETIYQAYPRHQGKGAALPAILRAMDRVPFDQLLEAVQSFAAAVQGWPEQDRQFVPHPATWIRGERWNDDRATWRRGGQSGRPRTAWNRLGSVDHLADVPGTERISRNVSIL